jgi:hypothetical protein
MRCRISSLKHTKKFNLQSKPILHTQQRDEQRLMERSGIHTYKKIIVTHW